MHIFIGNTLDGFEMYLSDVLKSTRNSDQPYLLVWATPRNYSTICTADDYVLMSYGPMPACELVATWMDEPERTAKEIEAARSFLGLNIV